MGMNSLNLVFWCQNRITMTLKPYSRDFLVKNNNKMLSSEPYMCISNFFSGSSGKS